MPVARTIWRGYNLSSDTENALYALLVFVLMLSVLVFGSIATTSFAQTVDDDNNNDNSNSLLPTIQITKPSYCTSKVSAGEILVQGNTNGSNGISKVEAFSHGYPFNGRFPFLPAEPVRPGNWSSWSITLDLFETGVQRIIAKVTDNNGTEGWAEVILNVAATVNPAGQAQETDSNMQDNMGSNMSSSLSSSSDEPRINKRIAFVEPTFTDAAYNVDGFYPFFFKYPHVPEGVNVTTDLNLMTAEIPKEIDRTYFMPFVERVKSFVPDSEVSIIRDQDVHNGALSSEDGTNTYDVLLLLHNEYVTQEAYDSFKNFVKNGGRIIFINPNIFYAEVTYDEKSCSVTLVKGHDWEFDGRAAKKSVSERYFEENKEWIGSNFVVRDIRDPVIFRNNPFNYTHFEENYLNNPLANILVDYNATFVNNTGSASLSSPDSEEIVPLLRGVLRDLLMQNSEGEYLDERHQDEAQNNVNKRIATYTLQYGQGEVLMLGIYGQNMANNTRFLDFFENIILTRAIEIPQQIVIDANNNNSAFTTGTANNSNPDNNIYSNNSGTAFYWKMDSGRIEKAVINAQSKSLEITLARSKSVPDSLLIVLPKSLIDAPSNNISGIINANFVVTVNGSHSMYDQISDGIETALVIPLSPDSKVVEIFGTRAVPEFSMLQANLATTIIIIAGMCALGIIRRKSQ
jgi:hypothetical protein